jgi:general secretion pathway protein G
MARERPAITITLEVSRNAARTLLELVVVVLILGILAGVAAPKFFSATVESKDDSVRASLSSVRMPLTRTT